MQIIGRTYNSYRLIDGVILSWDRGTPGAGHSTVIIEKNHQQESFTWRAPHDPNVGDQVSIIMPYEGLTTKKDRPLIILNHTTGEYFREQNAPDPIGFKRIMSRLIIWVAIAMIISAAIILNAEPPLMQLFLLISAAMIVWRIAIATSDLRYDDRATRRKHDEDALCLEMLTRQWEQHGPRLPRISFDASQPAASEILEAQRDTSNLDRTHNG